MTPTWKIPYPECGCGFLVGMGFWWVWVFGGCGFLVGVGFWWVWVFGGCGFLVGVGVGRPEIPQGYPCQSLPEIDIQTTLEPLTETLCMSLHDQSGQKEDIVHYVCSVVSSDRKMQRWCEKDKILVIETLAERADGM